MCSSDLPATPQAKALIRRHRETVAERLRAAPLPHAESPFSTSPVDPMAALMFAASIDRCPHSNLEELLAEAWELLQCATIRAHAIQSGFAGCIYRFLTEFTETQKRIPCLRLLVLLAEEDSEAVVDACKVAAQGQFWEPNMFVLTLQKRHKDNPELCELAARLMGFFAEVMPIPPPIVLERPSPQCRDERQIFESLLGGGIPSTESTSPPRSPDGGLALPRLAGGNKSPTRPMFSPTTTISKLYQEAPSPYCPTMLLPLTRPPTSPVEQGQRAKIFSMPKLAAVEGQRQYRCSTPNAPSSRVERSINYESSTLDPLMGSPLRSPGSPSKTRVALSEKYSWNPECINSVSGFEWWWRSLPQNHASLEPTQKLKMVTKAAVRLHSKGELHRAIELYLLALSSDTNAEVKFRLRINLACAYESADDLPSSIAEFRRALELNPDDPYALYKLGIVLTSSGEFDEARRHFEAILNEYPQAAEGLRDLEKTKAEFERAEEARKAAIAAAKVRRSPPKIVSPRVFETEAKPREPVAPSTPGVQVPAPHRKKPTAKRERPSPGIEPSPQSEKQALVAASPENQTPRRPETATVSTSTDESSSTPSVMDLLVRRCQEASINMHDVLKKLDPQQRGLVHKESIVSLLEIVVSIHQLSDETAQEVFSIDPSDWVLKDDQVFLRYGNFLAAYTTKHRAGSSFMTPEELVKVKAQVNDLIGNDVSFLSNRSVAEWMRRGREKVIAERCGGRVTTTGVYQSGRRQSNNMQAVSEELDADEAEVRTPRTGGRQQSTRRLSGLESGANTLSASNLNDENTITPRTRVKKEKAREEWLLTAEKARVLARRQQHCMKSLRDIAARAKAHIAARRRAVVFLAGLAQNAREELAMRRLRCVAGHQDDFTETANSVVTEGGSPVIPPLDIATESENLDTLLSSIRGLSAQTYDNCSRTAMVRVTSNTEIEGVKAVASRFAGFCQVPPYFLELRG